MFVSLGGTNSTALVTERILWGEDAAQSMWADAVPTNINLLRSKTQFGYFISKIHRVSSGYKFK